MQGESQESGTGHAGLQQEGSRRFRKPSEPQPAGPPPSPCPFPVPLTLLIRAWTTLGAQSNGRETVFLERPRQEELGGLG